MNRNKLKKVGSFLLISTGAIALVSEMYSVNKNYYIQSCGLVVLMLGLFLVNSKLKSKTENSTEEYFEEE